MKPDKLFTALSDPTRLRSLMLIQSEGEVCVCEMTFALDESQPKISRHLALLRDAGILSARREGTWMHYSVTPDIPTWARRIIEQVHRQLHGRDPFVADLAKLRAMSNRPGENRCA